MTQEYKYVPVEPTRGMLDAMQELFPHGSDSQLYKAAIAAAPDQPSPAEPMDRERPTVPRDIAYLIEQYGNARADDETTSTAYSALIVGLRGWAASLVDREAIRNAALEEAFAVCNAYSSKDCYSDQAKWTAKFIAGEISNLKSQPAQPSDSQAEVSDTEIIHDALGCILWLERRLQHGYGNSLGHVETTKVRIKAAMQAEKESP